MLLGRGERDCCRVSTDEGEIPCVRDATRKEITWRSWIGRLDSLERVGDVLEE